MPRKRCVRVCACVRACACVCVGGGGGRGEHQGRGLRASSTHFQTDFMFKYFSLETDHITGPNHSTNDVFVMCTLPVQSYFVVEGVGGGCGWRVWVGREAAPWEINCFSLVFLNTVYILQLSPFK